METLMAPETDPARTRYDPVSISLHWLTALLVVTLYALAKTWDLPARHSPLHSGMIITHVSLGVALVATVAARIPWRLFAGRRLPVDPGGIPGALGRLAELGARAAHYLIYVLLVTVVVLGCLLRWSQGHALTFFGLFTIPSPLAIARSASHQIHGLHSTVATVLIILAGLHAVAALFHHYVLRDSILQRMLPMAGRRQRMRAATGATPDALPDQGVYARRAIETK
jgi:cytochrome b561